MTFTTTIHKQVTCPQWNEKISLSAKYLLLDDTYEAKFIAATCPIVENLRQPYSKRNPDYALFHSCNTCSCPLLDDFPQVIDARTTHAL